MALKERLLGAVVLVALAVIFLPMLLDGAGVRESSDEALAIPERPETPDQATEALPDDPAEAVDRDAAAVASDAADGADGDEAQDAGEDAADGADGEEAQDANEDAADGADGDEAQDANEDAADDGGDTAAEGADDGAGDAPEAADDGAEDAAEPADANDPDAASDPESVKAWAVQTGSFSRRDNAVAQRDGLREEGFDAFVQRSGSGDNAIWRVRVGPVAMEADARALSERLASEHGFEPILVNHPGDSG